MTRRIKSLNRILEAQILKDKNIASILFLNIFITILQIGYTIVRSKYLNPEIPLWYTRPWGDYQLAPSAYIYIFPAISIILILGSVAVIYKLHKDKSREAVFTTLTLLTISVCFLYISELRIISKASVPFKEIIDNTTLQLLPLTFLAFLLCVAIVPFVIKFAKRYDIVTDPAIHRHPGMILKQPSARAGAVAFYLAFVVIALVFVPLNRGVVGLLIGVFLTTAIGLIDDKKSLNPYLRLLILMPIAILVTLLLSNFRILFFANPVDGIVRLDFWQTAFHFLDVRFLFIPIADIFTVIWILWVMNMLSWSNAVDGQFSGMTAITCGIIAMLSLRLIKIDPSQLDVAKLAAIAAGASLGILPYNWHPSKIMWGFGATSMGLVISILSIMAGTKVAAATLVLIVPTLDALITIIRRIIQGKSPVWGDRGHLHHRLLDMGFSQQEVSIFYWMLTTLFGLVALISSGRTKFLALLTLGGIVAFTLVALNLKGELGKLKPRQTEK